MTNTPGRTADLEKKIDDDLSIFMGSEDREHFMGLVREYAKAEVEKAGCGMCGCVRFLKYDQKTFHERMVELLKTCSKGKEFDWNWYLDSLDDDIRLISKSVQDAALTQAAEIARKWLEGAKKYPGPSEFMKLGRIHASEGILREIESLHSSPAKEETGEGA